MCSGDRADKWESSGAGAVVVEVQLAIRPNSPPSEGAVVKGRILVSGVEVVRKVGGGVEKKLENVRSSMFWSDMATTNEDDFCFANKE